MSLQKFRVGDIVKCVDASGTTSLVRGQLYRVTQVNNSIITVELANSHSGYANVSQSRFKLVTLTEQASERTCTDADHKVVSVRFNTGSQQYNYFCSFEGVAVGDYVIVPDRQTSFKYAIVKVVRVLNASTKARVHVVDVVNDTQYLEQEEARQRQEKLNDLQERRAYYDRQIDQHFAERERIDKEIEALGQ